MNTCKACKKVIEPGATKCSFCQAHQKWYNNPQVYSLVFMLPLMFLIIWNTNLLNEKNFSDFESEFSFTEEKVIDIKGSKAKLITYNVKNNTKHKWNRISYEVVSSQNGELLASMSDSNYDWVIQPNSESLLTVKVALVPNANEWQLKIKDLKSNRY